MRNREQRRKYLQKIAKNKKATKCPICGYNSLYYTQARGPEDTVVRCEINDCLVLEGPEVTKLVPPNIFLPLPLDIFTKGIDYAKEHPDELGMEKSTD